ncbi:MAG: metallophosphoesterase [Cognaticolwellia sp.]
MSKKITIAQISDCHLFADPEGLHHQANVYQNLKKVLLAIKQQPLLDAIIFTGDLTQDHSPNSYQLFVKVFDECEITLPVYYLAGNHDEPLLLQQYLSSAPFRHEKIIELKNWQVLLMDSKSTTPAGEVSEQQIARTADMIKADKSQLILMHHHPIEVGFFIDQHGLINQAGFQQFLAQYPSIAAVACGHVHQALTLSMPLPERSLNVYTCPATSIQFDRHSATVKANGQPPGYRLFTLAEKAGIESQVIFV